jgi:hypothetical protein
MLPGFLDSQHMNLAKLSALRTGHLYPSGDIPVTHFLLEAESTPAPQCGRGLSQREITMTPLGIEPAPFRLVAQCTGIN